MLLISHFATINQRRILFFINPKSNNGLAPRQWSKIVKKFPELLPTTQISATKTRINQLIKKHQPQYIAVAAGDGTINRVAQKLLQHPQKNRPILAIIPLGYGNALAYNLGFQNSTTALNELLYGNHTQSIDVIKINNRFHPISLFNVSIGYDAQIVRYTQKTRYIGLKSYFLSAIRSFFDYIPKTLSILVDKTVTIESETESLVVANAPYIGQSFLISPNASLTNGTLDCVLFPSKYAYLTNLRFRGFTHPLYRKTGKVYFQAQEIIVDNAPYLQIDGDPVKQTTPIHLQILPKALECICK